MSTSVVRPRVALSWRRAALLALALPAALAAQSGASAARASAGRFDSAALAALEWREIGPFRGGRSVAVAGSAERPYEYWMGTTGGGVFKTTDGGHSWEPMSDKYFGGTIGAIGVSESNPDIVYVGTGEYDIRGNVSHGDGVWKTTDGGKTWTHVGLEDTRQIARVKVDPRDPDVAYVGALGHVWAPNPERGVFKTTDGGKTWRKILFRNDSTGITDLVLDPNDPSTIYAAFWQAGRTPWLLVSGGVGSGIFKSTDGGEHWTELTRNPGLPKGIIGNIGLAVSSAKPGRVWAIVEADSGGVFRTRNEGQSWEAISPDLTRHDPATLGSRINDTLSAANAAVRTIRNVRARLAAVESRLGSSHAHELRALTGPLVDSLSRIEETIYQVHSRSSEDPLNFPIRINDKLAALASYVDDGNGRPTAQSYEVFDELATQLAVELRALRNTLRALDRVNALLAGAGLPAIVPSSAELPQPPSLIRE